MSGVNVIDHGANPNGLAESQFGFAKAALASKTDPSGSIFVPQGTFLFTSSFRIDAPIEFAPGGMLLVPAGSTVTITKPIVASDYQQVFTGPGTVVLWSNSYLSVCWFGADSTGDADSAPAFQSTVNAAQLVLRGTFLVHPTHDSPSNTYHAPPEVFIPAGVFSISKSTVINAAGMHIRGAGVGNTTIQSQNSVDPGAGGGTIPCFIATTPDGEIPVQPSLVHGPGSALDLDAYIYPPQGPKEHPAIYNYVIPSMESQGLAPAEMTTFAEAAGQPLANGFTCRFFYRIAKPATELCSVLGIHGVRMGDEWLPQHAPLAITIDSTQRLTVGFFPQPTTARPMVWTHETRLDPQAVYHVAFSWDGTAKNADGTFGTGRFFVAEVLDINGVPTKPKNQKNQMAPPQPVSGPLMIFPYHQTSIGSLVQGFPDGSQAFHGFGQIDSVEFRRDALYKAPFAPPIVQDHL